MIDKYKEFFQEEIEQTNAVLANIATSETIHKSIGLILLNYDLYRENKIKLDRFSEEEKEEIKQINRQNDQFVDGLIQSLNDDFEEKEVTVDMRKRVKYEYIR